MKIAFLHYHLKTGGVTTVIREQIAAIQGVCEALVLTGEDAKTPWPCEVAVIPELGYDRPGRASPAPEQIASQVLKAVLAVWPKGCDVLHVHNPTLAKNRGLLGALDRLQRSGVPLFVQIHDFAEDGRPGAYSRAPYPRDCHYGVLNSRDRGILLRSGLDPGGVHRIPNTVRVLPNGRTCCAEPLVLYPVRAIRRKNIGEAILLSLFLPKGCQVAVTQPPNSPQDIQSYRDWRRFVKDNRLNVGFDVGIEADFPALVGGAVSMVTTSITEGFGLSFLEPWMAGKLLWGRKLAEICRDFERCGVRLDHLYSRIRVPTDGFGFDRQSFGRRWRAAVEAAAEAFGIAPAPQAMARAQESVVQREVMDFGDLDEVSQRRILLGLLKRDAAARTRLITLNPWLQKPGVATDAADRIAHNRSIIADHYGPERCRDRLVRIYTKVMTQPVRHRIDKRVLLDAFFCLDRFPLLKWGAYGGSKTGV